MCCHLSTVEELEIYDTISANDIKGIEANTKGVINYAIKANFARKHFWTASIWENQDSLRSFMITEPHANAVKKFSEWSGDGSAFVEWTDRSDSINWTDALKKLQNPTYYYKKD
jgi:hypothetical protein